MDDGHRIQLMLTLTNIIIICWMKHFIWHYPVGWKGFHRPKKDIFHSNLRDNEVFERSENMKNHQNSSHRVLKTQQQYARDVFGVCSALGQIFSKTVKGCSRCYLSRLYSLMCYFTQLAEFCKCKLNLFHFLWGGSRNRSDRTWSHKTETTPLHITSVRRERMFLQFRRPFNTIANYKKKYILQNNSFADAKADIKDNGIPLLERLNQRTNIIVNKPNCLTAWPGWGEAILRWWLQTLNNTVQKMWNSKTMSHVEKFYVVLSECFF